MTNQQYAGTPYELGQTFGDYSAVQGYRDTLDSALMRETGEMLTGIIPQSLNGWISEQNPQRRLLEAPGFNVVVPYSGGHDSGTTLKLLAEAYEQREKQLDSDIVIAFSSTSNPYGGKISEDSLNKEFIERLQREHPSVPLEHRIVDTQKFNEATSEVLESILGYKADSPWLNSVVLGNLMSEYTTLTGPPYMGVDSSNHSEGTLGEESNGCAGLNSIAPLWQVPKSLLFAVSDQLGITQDLPCSDSILPRDASKAQKYFSGAPMGINALKDVFAVIDTTVITHLENPELSVDELSKRTQLPTDITRNILKRVEMAYRTQPTHFELGNENNTAKRLNERNDPSYLKLYSGADHEENLNKLFNKGGN